MQPARNHSPDVARLQAGRRDLVEDHVNLEELGRRLGVLETWEFLKK
jgi:hypothetical protein